MNIQLKSIHSSESFYFRFCKFINLNTLKLITNNTYSFFVVCSKTSCQFINCDGSPRVCKHKVVCIIIACLFNH